MVGHGQKYNQLLLVRGVEGSTLLPFDRRAPFITMQQKHEPDFDFMSPETVGVEPEALIDQDPSDSLEIGVKALQRGAHQLFKLFKISSTGHWDCYKIKI